MGSGRVTRGKLLTLHPEGALRAPEPFPLHERLREERDAARISQAELGLRLGKTQAWVSRVEKGVFEVPGRLLPAYAAALGITVSRLFNEAFARAS
jgi:transcriptional regulator with XRE-family HTH domain